MTRAPSRRRLFDCAVERSARCAAVRTTPDPLPPLPPSGIPEMDAAHARLWSRMRELWCALAQAPLSDAMACCVTLLMELREEYSGEEALMARHRYPGTPMHRASHTLLEGEFSALARAIRDAGRDPPRGVRARLAETLLAAGSRLASHVQQVDIPLARHVRAAARPGSRPGLPFA